MRKHHSLPRLHKIASTDDLRPNMQGVYIDKDIGVATDGHVLIQSKITDHIENPEHLDGRIIHKEAWKRMCECDKIIAKDDKLSLHYGPIWIEMYYEQVCIHEDYPNYKSIMPAIPTADALKKIDRIGFSAGLVDKIRIAMGLSKSMSQMTFYFYGKNKAIVVHSSRFDGVAILMPVMIEDYSFNDEESEREQLSEIFDDYLQLKPKNNEED